MAPEVCRATVKLTKEYLEDILEKVEGRGIGGSQGPQSSASPTKRKDVGFSTSPAKKVRLEG
jgi:hypothetical protein